MSSLFDTAQIQSPVTEVADILASLKQEFKVEQTGHIDFNLGQFSVLKNYTDVNLLSSHAVKNKHNDSYILFTEAQPKLTDHGKTMPLEQHVWALAYLKHDFGRVLIRRETLVDKIKELIHPVELDFAEDKAFSDTFYMLVSDRQKAISGADRSFRNVVMDIRLDDFVIEIVEHTLIIGNTKPRCAEKALHLAEFVSRLCTTCD